MKIKFIFIGFEKIFNIKNYFKSSNLRQVSNVIIHFAILIFILYSCFTYYILKNSYNIQKKVYQDGYLCSVYANNIQKDIWEIRLFSLYSVTFDQSMISKVNSCEDDIVSNINKYKTLHNLTNVEKRIIDQLEAANNQYLNILNQQLAEIKNSKTTENTERQTFMSQGNNMIEIIGKLVAYSNQYYISLNKENMEVQKTTKNTIIIINVLMAALFVLIFQTIKRISRKVDYYAFYDYITGLPNKRYMIDMLVKEVPKINKYTLLVSLDIDNFKAVNDRIGHIQGNIFLCLVGNRLKKAISIYDYIYHIGEDEFFFLIKSADNKNEAEKVVKNIQNVFKTPIEVQGEKIDYITASIGIAAIPQDGNDFETLYACASDALHLAKTSGKNRYNFYNNFMHINLYEIVIKKKDIEHGIYNNEFKVFYQPKFSKNNKFIGAEALVRWIKEDGRIIYPSEFIEFSENFGLIKYIGEVVITEVCKKISGWIKSGYYGFKIAINLSAEQLIDDISCINALNIIQQHNIPFEYIEFEVTETKIIKNFNAAVSNILKIKSCGIKVTLDDFGTGYSSLNYLKNLPIDSIKIDKSFVDNLGLDESSSLMIDMIIKLSHQFGYDVVAEGVEREEQIAHLKALNCDVFQGYYFGKPMEEESFENMFLMPISMKEE